VPVDVNVTTTSTGATVLALVGELDAGTAPELLTTLYDAIDQAPRDVTVDLSMVTFMDCAIVGSLVAARSRAGAHGLRLTVRSATRQPLAVLTLTDTLEWLSGAGTAAGSVAVAGGQ
jgi:anti-anti-sigma factor